MIQRRKPASRRDGQPRLEVVHQSRVRIETDHVHGIGDEVGKRVYVVEIVLAIPIIDQVLDPSYVEARPPGYRLN